MMISLEDLFLALQKNRKSLFWNGILFGALALFFILLKPLLYSTEGRFATMESTTSFSSLESLIKPKQTHLPLLYYYPVLERTIQSLHLQAEILPHKRPENRKFWNKWKAELFYLQPWIKRPDRQSYTHSLIPSDNPPLSCTSLCYKSHFSSKLQLTFIDEKNFRVTTKKGHYLGEGCVEQPFVWEDHSFIVTKNGTQSIQGQSFILQLQPLEIVRTQLQRRVRVKKDPLSVSTYVVQYSHGDGYSAATLINSFMNQYQYFLEDLAKKKIGAYNSYLSLRKEEAQKIIHQEASCQITKDFASLEMEQKYLNQQQAQTAEHLSSLLSQIELLDAKIHGCKRPFAQIPLLESTETIDLPDSLLQRIAIHQNSLDQIETKINQCDSYVTQIESPTSILPNLISFPLQGLATKIEKLEHSLQDERNFSQKERYLLSEQLILEKAVLKNEILKLKENYVIERQSLISILHELQKSLLTSLFAHYAQAQKKMTELETWAKTLPEKWSKEIQREGIIALETNMIKGLAQLIEGQNLQEQIAPYNVIVLHNASPPALVNPPYLLLGFCIGAIVGLFLTILKMIFIQEELLLPLSFSRVKEYVHRFLDSKLSNFSTIRK